MNRTDELIKILKEYVDDIKDGVRDYISSYVLTEAANTIEQLAAKVRAANMERSTAYYNGGWIPVNERLPKNSGEYLVSVIDDEDEDYKHVGVAYFAHPNDYDIDKGEWRELMMDEKVVAWMPLPEPYREDGE